MTQLESGRKAIVTLETIRVANRENVPPESIVKGATRGALRE
jgi:hypothetical protein